MTLDVTNQQLSEEYYERATVFFCGLGIPEGCFPVKTLRGIVQAFADVFGYTVVLRAHRFEPAPEETGGLNCVGHLDVLTAKPEIFFVTDKCGCCSDPGAEDDCLEP